MYPNALDNFQLIKEFIRFLNNFVIGNISRTYEERVEARILFFCDSVVIHDVYTS